METFSSRTSGFNGLGRSSNEVYLLGIINDMKLLADAFSSITGAVMAIFSCSIITGDVMAIFSFSFVAESLMFLPKISRNESV